jgi:hypothetical protein
MAKLLSAKETLVFPRGTIANTHVLFPEGFEVHVDTVDLNRISSGTSEGEFASAWDAARGIRQRYETAMWIWSPELGSPYATPQPAGFPIIVVGRYYTEEDSKLGHAAFVDEVRRGRVSWVDIDDNTPLVKDKRFTALLRKREAVLKGASRRHPEVRVRSHSRRRTFKYR